LAFLFPRDRNYAPIKAHSPAFAEAACAFRITGVPLQFAAAATERRMKDNKNVLYLFIGVLLVAVAVLGFNLYQAKKQPEGLQINVGPDGLKIQNK
jgi:RsiW-degrading membrane proteinase PrsW (M82 family)